MAKVTLFNAANGLSCVVDAGAKGLRGKPWLDELSRWAKEATEPQSLAGIGLGRMANFSAIIDGQKMGVKPLGESYSTPDFNGVELFDVIPNSSVLATGDGADVTIGNDVLTEPDKTHANYFNTTTDPDDLVAPRGGSAPAFLQSVADAGGLNLSTGEGTITINVNGVAYAVAVGVATSTTVEVLRTAITNSGAPVDVAIEGGDTLRIFTLGKGISQNISVDANTASGIIFTGAGQSSQAGVTYRGTNGPLGQNSNADQVASGSGLKPQARILPGSVVVTATIGAATVTLTDDRAGALSDITGTHTGTINYTTGVIAITFGTAPDNATAVNASWKALRLVPLHEECRLPDESIGPQAGRPIVEMALRLK